MKRIFAAALCLSLILICSHALALAADKDTLVVLDQYDATTMDPIGHNDVPSRRACWALYDTLLTIDTTTGEIGPNLAVSWELISGSEFKMNLRRGVKFHNGEEMKASDVRYSLMRTTGDLGARVRTYAQVLKDVEVIDDYTVVIKLKEADYSWFPSLGHGWSMIVSEKAAEAAGDTFGQHPVGTGPFKFVEWSKNSYYKLERFDDFWGEPAKIKYLEVRSVPEPTSRTIQLETGEADVAYPIAVNDIPRIEGDARLELYRSTINQTMFMGFNCFKAPFNDAEVRNAIADAIDVVGIQQVVMRGVGKVPTSFVPDQIKYSIGKSVPVHQQNTERAIEVLKKKGLYGKLGLTIWTNERKERVDMVTIIQQQLSEVGIDAKIQVLEWGAYLTGLREKKHDLYMMGWTVGVPDPNFAISGVLEGSENTMALGDKHLDEMLARGRRTPDGPERAALYKEIQEYINAQRPMIYLNNDECLVGANKRVHDLDIRSDESHSFRKVWKD